MQVLLSNHTTTISKLKQSPSEIINNLTEQPVAILKNGIANAYLISAKTLERLTEIAEDIQDGIECERRKNEPSYEVEFDKNGNIKIIK